MEILIGRNKEKEILNDALNSNKAEMIAVIGRRRVGKTFLINTVYKDSIIFKVSGVQNAPTEEQIRVFTSQLSLAVRKKLEQPKDWFDAFFLLIQELEPLLGDEKKVLFFDEIPWLASPEDGFIRGLDYFWNSWASMQNLGVVVCGSAASWMIQKVVNDTGGLHNRITKYIELKPFTLKETEEYIKSRYLNFTRYQIVELYMALGGIPHYLEEIKAGKSAIQNIDDICFSPTGLLKNEFSRLYPALFKHSTYHIEIIRALATKWKGMTRTEIIAKADVPGGGPVTKALEELQQSGFITSYHPFGKKKKDRLYRLTDEYSLFYLHFMEDKSNEGAGTWNHLSQTQQYKTWSGYAFESICIKHLAQIKKALGISGVYSKTASFFKKGTAKGRGTQIDLLIDRADNVINIVEVKFYNKEFSLTKETAEQLRQKKWTFEDATKTRKLTSIVLMTTFGLKHNMHSLGLVEKVLSLEDLFD